MDAPAIARAVAQGQGQELTLLAIAARVLHLLACAATVLRAGLVHYRAWKQRKLAETELAERRQAEGLVGIKPETAAADALAVFITLWFAADRVRGWIGGKLPKSTADQPYTEITDKLLLWADQSLYLFWPAGLLGLVEIVFARRRPYMAGAFWATGALAYLAGYPGLRREAYLRVTGAWEVLAFIGEAVVMMWWAQADRRLTAERRALFGLVILSLFPIVAFLAPAESLPGSYSDAAEPALCGAFAWTVYTSGAAIWKRS